MAADLLTTIRAEIDARLSELRPLLAEYEQLTSATDALDSEGASVGGSASRPTRRRGAAAKAVRSKTARSKTVRSKTARPRPAGPGTVRAKAARAKTTRAVRPVRKRAGRGPSIGPAGQAILAALEHGSHTVAELVVVTALPAPDIRHDLRPLLKLEAIVKAERDGKTAYALAA